MKKILTYIRNHRSRRIVLFIIIGLLVLVGLVAAWNSYQWQQYVSKNDAQYELAQAKLANQLQSVETIDDIRATMDTLDEATSKLCKAPLLTDLRSNVLSDTQEYQAKCQLKYQSLVSAKEPMQQIYSWLQAENSVAKVFDEAAGQLSKIKNDDYSAQQKLWKQIKADIGDLTVDDSYKSVKESYIQAITDIIKRYDGLVAANKAEKRSQFDDAVVELRDAYSGIDSIEDDSAAQYEVLSKQAYDAIAAIAS